MKQQTHLLGCAPFLQVPKPSTNATSTASAFKRKSNERAKLRRSSMFTQESKSSEKPTAAAPAFRSAATASSTQFKSFILKVVFPPVGIEHRHSGRVSPSLHDATTLVQTVTEAKSLLMGGLQTVVEKTTKLHKPVDKGGFMKKRGHTVHTFTSDFKTRWFELDTSNLLLTYYETQPPLSIMGDGEQNQLAEEKKKELKKGAVDLSIVEEIKPSEHRKKRAFELITATRTWVMVPDNDEDEAGWLSNLCKMVPSDGVHSSYTHYIAMDPLNPVQSKKNTKKDTKEVLPTMGAEIDSQKVLCNPTTTTVGDVLSECFRLFRRRTQKDLDPGKFEPTTYNCTRHLKKLTGSLFFTLI